MPYRATIENMQFQEKRHHPDRRYQRVFPICKKADNAAGANVVSSLLSSIFENNILDFLISEIECFLHRIIVIESICLCRTHPVFIRQPLT